MDDGNDIIEEQDRIDDRQRQYIRQAIMLTALGSPVLEAIVSAIQDIERRFARTLPENAMNPWVPAVFDDHPAINMGNRYLTDGQYKGTQESIPFKSNVDSDGILA
ncbi:hypothetical protein Hypma_000164 [Hypsizygus marmoreus]|uniref:Uncharacterized protein n=1 Tax=Hypsizygus marmoreus TaxID=39966 RepID=A0A369KBS1_HYPMA|nr:hypothetical protein Hypma_000164 [Hypsizygus marmoreus]